nr:unnamed protein product [Callosobruchus chinensis]
MLSPLELLMVVMDIRSLCQSCTPQIKTVKYYNHLPDKILSTPFNKFKATTKKLSVYPYCDEEYFNVDVVLVTTYQSPTIPQMIISIILRNNQTGDIRIPRYNSAYGCSVVCLHSLPCERRV